LLCCPVIQPTGRLVPDVLVQVQTRMVRVRASNPRALGHGFGGCGTLSVDARSPAVAPENNLVHASASLFAHSPEITLFSPQSSHIHHIQGLSSIKTAT